MNRTTTANRRCGGLLPENRPESTGLTGLEAPRPRFLRRVGWILLMVAGAAGAGFPLWAQNDQGNVELPLERYNQLVDKSREPRVTPPSAPAAYTIGNGDLKVQVREKEGVLTTEISVTVKVQVFVDEWVSVPLLSAGTAVAKATVEGQPLQLVSDGRGLSWSIQKAGAYTIELVYSTDVLFSDQGRALAVPVPAAAAMKLDALLPGAGLDVAVIPGVGVKTFKFGDQTHVTATIPASTGILISWRQPTGKSHTISRADYRGRLIGQAVAWEAVYDLEIFGDDTVPLKMLPADMTLSSLKIDDKPAAVMLDEGFITTIAKGRGLHKLNLSFEVPVLSADGPPKVDMYIPKVPISRFELRLPGKKELSVTPNTNVVLAAQGDNTVASFHLPLAERLAFSWVEAVPEEVTQEFRANVELFHTLHAEEGVLYVRAIAVFNVARGQTNNFVFEVPYEAQINEVSATSGRVVEWIPKRGQAGPYPLSVFLDRQVKDDLVLEILYEQALPDEGPVPVPLLKAGGVSRQRGTVALLADREFTLKPVEEGAVRRVGENQLPAFVRDSIDRTIAHTFKYLDRDPGLTVLPAKPERKEGKFDAAVNSLISLGDVTMRGASGIEINVKSGGITELKLELPADVNLLSLSAPSLRTYKLSPEGDNQTIDIQFTQEMEGQFRAEVIYERITSDSQSEVGVPTPKVRGAEVEQGQIGIEALSAVEVQPSTVEQLSSLDVNELPQQLILKTTNPILLAYKYVHTETPFKLGLKITRHQEIDVQAATIDQGNYQTLYTRDGLAVTTAHFTVRNNRKQFLKIKLPKGSEVWSAMVAGQAVKPALVAPEVGKKSDDGSAHILIKIINSSEGFPVELIYATASAKIQSLGKLRGRLPRPDIVVTHTRWAVYLPEGPRYGAASSNLELVDIQAGGRAPSLREGKAEDRSWATQTPMKIDVPTSGVCYTFKKLYANRSDEESEFVITYASTGGRRLAWLFSVVGTILLWLGLGFALKRPDYRRRALSVAAAGLFLLAIPLVYFRTGIQAPLGLTILLVAGYAAMIASRKVRDRLRQKRERPDAAEPPLPSEPDPEASEPPAEEDAS